MPGGFLGRRLFRQNAGHGHVKFKWEVWYKVGPPRADRWMKGAPFSVQRTHESWMTFRSNEPTKEMMGHVSLCNFQPKTKKKKNSVASHPHPIGFPNNMRVSPLLPVIFYLCMKTLPVTAHLRSHSNLSSIQILFYCKTCKRGTDATLLASDAGRSPGNWSTLVPFDASFFCKKKTLRKIHV